MTPNAKNGKRNDSESLIEKVALNAYVSDNSEHLRYGWL